MKQNAQVILWRMNNGTRELLIQKKKKGYLAFPGGCKNGNETLKDCAIRELFEETQVCIKYRDTQFMGLVTTSTELIAVYLYSNACTQCVICPESSSSMEIDLTWKQNGYTWMSISTIIENKSSFCNYAWIAMMILFNFNSHYHCDMHSYECRKEFLNGTCLPVDNRFLTSSNICSQEPVQRSDCARW